MAKQYIQKCSHFRRCMMMISKKQIFIYSHGLRVTSFNYAVLKNESQSRALNIYLQKCFAHTPKCDYQQRYIGN